MNKIKTPNKNFEFNSLNLSHPTGLQGGSYFTKLNCDGDSLYFQGNRCLTKQGLVKTEKKIYCDLLYSSNDEDFIEWIENLEKRACELIYSKRKTWFDNELELEDIENAFTPPLRSYKSGKYQMLRVGILHSKDIKKELLSCYNEDGKEISTDNITSDVKIIPIIDVQGIKFSSRYFQLEFVLKQVMVMNENKFDTCMIQKNVNKSVTDKEEKLEEPPQSPQPAQSAQLPQSPQPPEPPVAPQPPEKEELQEQARIEKVDETQSMNEISEISGNNLNLEVNDELTLSDDDEEGVVKDVNENQLDEQGENNEEELEEEEEDEEDEEEEEENEDEEDEEDEMYEKIKNLNDGTLEEINVDSNNLEEYDLKLKDPNEIYFEIWKNSRTKAKKLKKQALNAYLEAKKIKSNYMLNELDNSDDEFDEFVDKYVNRL